MIDLNEMTSEEYFDAHGLNRSTLWTFHNKSPAHSQVQPSFSSSQQDALNFGTAFHSALLEPDTFKNLYIEGPCDSKAKAEWKKAKLATSKTLLKPSEFKAITAMKAAIENHTDALNSALIKEASTFWEHEITGLDLKARYDAVDFDNKTIIDIKTTQSADPKDFPRSIVNFGYHFQAAWYLDPLPDDWRFLIIAVEKTPPYGVCLYEFLRGDTPLNEGTRIMRESLNKYAQCLTTDDWPCYSRDVHSAELPGWYQ